VRIQDGDWRAEALAPWIKNVAEMLEPHLAGKKHPEELKL
jgi:hypothetical protein